MLPITREEIYLYKLAGNTIETPEPITRKELYLAKACGESVEIPEPITREETYLYKLAGADVEIPEPITTLECLMYAVCGGVIEIQPPVTHLEWFWYNILNTETTISGIPPLSFTSDGTALSAWIIYGNGRQVGTPTPDEPIMPDFCGVRTANVMPPGKKKTVKSNGITFESDGNGRYRIHGTSTAYASTRFYLASGFTTPISVSNNGQGTLSFFNTGTNANVTFVFYNGNTNVDGWGMSLQNRTSTTYNVIGNKYVDNVVITIPSGETVDMIITPEFTNDGVLPNEFEPYGYKIPLTCAGQTTPVYLGEVSTVRRIKKLVFDGSESWNWSTSGNNTRAYSPQIPKCMSSSPSICTHFDYNVANVEYPRVGEFVINSSKAIIFGVDGNTFADVDAWKSYLAQQYAAGTPVTVWYVLAEPETGIVNEPLCKIGDYADELHSDDAGVTIQTVSGTSIFDVSATLKPSSVTITGHISQ